MARVVQVARTIGEGTLGILLVTAIGCATQIVMLILTKAIAVAAISIIEDVRELLSWFLGW